MKLKWPKLTLQLNLHEIWCSPVWKVHFFPSVFSFWEIFDKMYTTSALLFHRTAAILAAPHQLSVCRNHFERSVCLVHTCCFSLFLNRFLLRENVVKDTVTFCCSTDVTKVEMAMWCETNGSQHLQTARVLVLCLHVMQVAWRNDGLLRFLRQGYFTWVVSSKFTLASWVSC